MLGPQDGLPIQHTHTERVLRKALIRTQKERLLFCLLNYARRLNRCWPVEGATPFGTPENSALKQ